MILTIDSQESPTRISMLKRIALRLGIGTEVKPSVGDVSIGSLFGAELKTPSDFISSIKDQRVFHQAKALTESYQRYAIIIEGTLPDVMYAKRGMTESSIMGAIYSLSVHYGVPVQFTHPVRSGRLEFHLDAAIRAGMKDGVAGASLIRRKSSTRDHGLSMLTSLPGIGTVAAHAILGEYGSIANAIKNIDNWGRDIHGIGVKTVDSIHSLFTKNLLEEP